jgi:cytochrome c oxidase assembly protein subunit 11
MAKHTMVKRGKNNGRTAFVLFTIVGAMVGLSFASVPLYRLFCQVTGYGGTPQISADATPSKVSERTITVRFDSNTNPDLPWRFKPVQKEMTVRLGEQALAFFEAESLSDVKSVGQATYNVTPFKVGTYFNKIDCFCFDEQVLMPGQSVSMPVQFFVDPEIFDDPNTQEVKTITLSYTFFAHENDEDSEEDKSTIKVSGQVANQNQIN